MKISRFLVIGIATAVYGCYLSRRNVHNSVSSQTPLSAGVTDVVTQSESEIQLDPIPPETANVLYIIIVGGGPHMVALLAQFKIIKLQPGKTVHITIIETNLILGPGPTYDKNELLDEHLANNDGYFFDMTTIKPPKDNSDFITWLPFLRRRHYGIGQSLKQQIAFPPPRKLIGEYLIKRYKDFKTACIELGYSIEEKVEKTAVSVSLVNNQYEIVLDDGQKLYTNNLILATGHWAESRFDHEVKGYFKHPWPADKLKKEIPKGKKVVIFGGSQSAIDAANTVSLNNGRFKEVGPNVFTYKRSKGCDGFKIIMYSRSGQFPSVRGWPFANTIDAKNFSQDAAKLKDENGRIPLFEFFKFVKKKFKELYAAVAETTGFDDATPEKFFDLIDGVLDKKLTPNETLQKHADKARESLEKNAPMEIQSLAASLIIPMVLNAIFFSTEDTIRLHKILPRFYKVGVPIPLRNAERMLALMKATPPALRIVEVGDDCEVTEATEHESGGVLFKCPDKEIDEHYSYFIDALGQSSDIRRSKSPLTMKLLEKNLIEPLRLELQVDDDLLEDTPEEDIRAHLAKNLGISKKKIEFDSEEQKFYYSAGGIEMDIGNFRAYSPAQQPRDDDVHASTSVQKQADGEHPTSVIYAGGPFIMGRFPIAQSTRVSVFGSMKMVPDIQKRYPAFFVQPPE